MKRFFLLLLAILPVLSLSTNVFATNSNAFYVNNAYFKGDGKYDIVVHDSNRETLRLYVNDKNPVKAKVNKKGWATFRDVELTGQSKLSFSKRIKLRYVPVSYIKYISVDSKHVKLSDIGLKHSYDDFSKWLATTVRYTEPLDLMQTPHTTSRFNFIRDKCGVGNGFEDGKWITCMQDSYKEYLKPEMFVGKDNQFAFLDMVGTVDNFNSFGSKYLTQDNINSAKDTYKKFAVMNRQ